jgi:ribosomal protein L37AE/L43A
MPTLPICPMPNLPLVETTQETCPYCGTVYEQRRLGSWLWRYHCPHCQHLVPEIILNVDVSEAEPQ